MRSRALAYCTPREMCAACGRASIKRFRCRKCDTTLYCSAACRERDAAQHVRQGCEAATPPPLPSVRTRIVADGLTRPQADAHPSHCGRVLSYSSHECRVCGAASERQFRCRQCNAAQYCSLDCREDDADAHARGGCVFVVGAAGAEPWYIDTRGLYLWQPQLPKNALGEFEPLLGDTLPVLLRLRADSMVSAGCNGCRYRHNPHKRHCDGYVGIRKLSDAQTAFAAEWRERLAPAGSIHTLFSVSTTRARFPGTWRLQNLQGIDEDGYRSGQADMTRVM